jgi:hypothetical protein
MKPLTILGLAGILALTAGCATSEFDRVDEDFGNSVRSLVQAQTEDPAASANPDPEGPEAADGQLLDNSLGIFRRSHGDHRAVNPEVLLLDP